MSYKSLLGNRTAHDRLQALVAGARVPHALLFAGPAGVGKRAAALEFAKSLLCADRGCDACPDCRRVDAGTHLNLRLLAHGEDSREIRIEQIRELLRELSLKALGAEPRVVVVDEAERMNEEAQNALLKTLEEPPDRCVILLVSASPALLLPTLVSRCQTVLFTPLAPGEMASFLATLTLAPAEAALVLALADGLPGRAKALASDVAALAARAREVLRRVTAMELNAVVEEIGKIRDTEGARERAREDLTIVALALREALRGGALGEPPNLCPPELLKRLQALDAEALADRIEIVLDHLRFIDLNANVPLTVEDALLRV